MNGTSRFQAGLRSRAGATLAEVLISLLIMGIGVVTIATMFPISVLRTVQATHLTNAANLSYNTRAMLDVVPSVVTNPDFDSGATRFSEHFDTNYIVDPFGFHQITGPRQNVFGRLPPLPKGFTPLQRFSGGTASLAQAANRVMLPDSWITVGKVTPTSQGAGFVILDPGDIDLANIAANAGDAPARIVMIDTSGRRSQTRIIPAPPAPPAPPPRVPGIDTSTGRITWSGANLPAGFRVEQARVETQEIRYTWLLTVHNRGNPASITVDIDVAVFVKRGVNPDDEQVFDVALTAPWPGLPKPHPRTLNIPPMGGVEPFLKKGGYLLDVTRLDPDGNTLDTGKPALNWYRIQKVVDNTVTLEQNPRNLITHAIMLPGIVDVYPLNPKAFIP